MEAAASPTTVLYDGALLTIGEFHLGPGDQRWREPNCIGEGYHVVFPRTAVMIEHEGRDAIVSDPNNAILYEPYQLYRRALVSPAGDHCLFAVVDPALIAELTDDDDPFRRGESSRSIPARAYLLQRTTAALMGRGTDDRLLIEEAMVRVLAEVLRGASSARSPRRIVESVKAVLADRFAEHLSLAQLASSVYVSPFHLARAFRSQTGSSIHAYRTQLRLRASLEHLIDGSLTLSQVAAHCGFCSHAHFTSAFKRAFGHAPSRIRRAHAEELLRLADG